MSESERQDLEQSIAILAMAGRFPGARDLEQLWRNLRDGVESITFFSEQELATAGIGRELLRDPGYVRACPRLEDAELFDAAFFDISPREAEVLDPQSRLFLECAWQALERAGYVAQSTEGRVGVFAGCGASTYQHRLWARPEVMASMGWFPIFLANDRDYFTTRVSYKLNLRGPSMNIQTACSTSLVAVHQACQSLLDYQCTLALAGGVRLAVPQESGYQHEPGGILSPDGHCRSFDAKAAGSLFGNGVGVVVLKRLEDALADGDPIEAVVRGSAVNNDGAAKVGFTAPSIKGQAEAIAMAHSVAAIDPRSITYVEAHGSATPLGDPIEVSALTDAFRAGTEATGFCALGSVKSNFGHLESAAGIAGLIKTVLALKHRQIPPSLHFDEPNPEIDFAETPFYVNTELTPWEPGGTLRRAGVSSFGMGGTNVHVVLEEAPARPPSGPSRPWQLLQLSGRTPTALETATDELARHLRETPSANLADIAYTLQVGRRSFEHRRALVCRAAADAAAAFETRDPERLLTLQPPSTDRPVVFLLPGLGEHAVDMGRGLYEREAVFRDELDRCAELLEPHLGCDLRQLLFPPQGTPSDDEKTAELDLARMLGRATPPDDPASRRLRETRYAQPAVFAVEIALARLWMAWGIRPQAMIGHSLGEYAAACLAGVMSLEDALYLVAERARLIHQQPPGAMIAVPFGEEAIRPHLGGDLGLAAANGPDVSVVAGSPAAVETLAERLDGEGIACRRLPTTHAFHSPMMQPVAEALAETLRQVRLAAPEIPYLSNVTGTWITPEEATDPAGWARHLVRPVRFADGVAELLADGQRVLLEVGPGQGLGALVRQTDAARVVLQTLPGAFERRDDQAFALGTLGRLWLAGVRVDWQGFYGDERRRRTVLPTYPFERRLFWIDAPRPPAVAAGEPGAEPSPEEGTAVEAGEAAAEPELALNARPHLPTPYTPPENDRQAAVAAIWREALGINQIGIHDSYFDMGGHSLTAPGLLLRLEQATGVELPLAALFHAPTVARLSELVERVRREGEGVVPAMESVDLAAEVELAADVRPAGDVTPRASWSDPEAVLLTGGTGFLGAFLLHELLAQTGARVYCLARAADAGAARQRLRRNLQHYRLVPQQGFEELLEARVVALPGDLGKPRLGLSEATFAELAESLDVIVHAGAWVNFTYPYSALEAANVDGTREALRLAARGRLKPFHFISSTAVFAPAAFDADGVVYEDDGLEHTEGLFSGYAESKWVCEKILGLARRRGVPVAIYRPGVIGGDSRSGAGNTSDLAWNAIKGCIQLGACVGHLPALDVAPADYVGRAIVHLAREPASLGRAFHFSNPRPSTWAAVFDFLRDLGYPLETLPYGEWLAALRRSAEAGEDNALVPFLPLLTPAGVEVEVDGDGAAEEPLQECEMRGMGHDGRNTREALAGTGIRCPPVDAELIRTYVAYFVDGGFLKPPPGSAAS